MKRVLLVLFTVVISVSAYSQHFAIKNNLLYDAMLTPNLGVEIGLGKRVTLDLNAGWHPFTLDEKKNKSIEHWLVQPELRIWGCERFSGTFFGIHAHGGEYDMSNIKLPWGIFPNLEDNRYDGYFYGGGISIGHQWVLGKHWNLEASIGAGYARMEYDKYDGENINQFKETGHYDYWGVTKATISFIYIIH